MNPTADIILNCLGSYSAIDTILWGLIYLTAPSRLPQGFPFIQIEISGWGAMSQR